MSLRIRVKPSRIDRLLRGLTRAGRYAGAPAVAVMMGCVPTMRPVSVSPDGRYAAIPYEQTQADGKKKAVFALVDLNTGAARVTQEAATDAWWYGNTDEVIVATKPDSDPPGVLVITKDGTKTIERALMPAVSPDGKQVAYSAADDGDAGAHGNLYLYDIASGESKNLGVAGIFASFSPDGKRLLYAAKQGTDKSAAWKLFVAMRDGSEAKSLGAIDPETAQLFCPQWLSDSSVIFRTRTAGSPDDGELFIADLEGKREQITHNDLEDVNPQVIGPSRFVYAQAFDSKKQKNVSEHEPVEVWIAEKKDGKWQHRSLGVKACYFTATPKWLIYAGKEAEFFRMPLDDPSKAESLSGLIAKQTAEK